MFSFVETVNKIYLKSKFKNQNLLKFMCAGSIKKFNKKFNKTILNLQNLNINRVKIRLNQ